MHEYHFPALIPRHVTIAGLTTRISISRHRNSHGKNSYVADAVLSGALGACVGAYEVSCLRKEVVVTGVACIDGLFWVMPKSPEPASVPGALSVEGPTPTPSVSPRGNVTLGRGSGWWQGSSSQ